MLALPHTNSWGFVYTNAANGSTAPGQSVTPGASDVEGSAWTEIGPDASITSDIYYISLIVHAGQTGGQSKLHLLDVAYDPTGGTTYSTFLFQDLACGGARSMANGGGRPYHFPCKIPAGSAIAARIQGSNATAGTVLVFARFYGKPSRPELWRPAAYSETLGYTSGTLGTAFTPGNASFGAWASLGTTTKKHFWLQGGVQLDNGITAARGTRVQFGVGDGTNMHVISELMAQTDSAENLSHDLQTPCQWEIQSGAEIWVRGSCSGAPDTGYNATAVLFGG